MSEPKYGAQERHPTRSAALWQIHVISDPRLPFGLFISDLYFFHGFDATVFHSLVSILSESCISNWSVISFIFLHIRPSEIDSYGRSNHSYNTIQLDMSWIKFRISDRVQCSIIQYLIWYVWFFEFLLSHEFLDEEELRNVHAVQLGFHSLFSEIAA
jgi:hypothetical protein